MQRNKYLDDLGIPITEYGTNFIDDNDERNEEWKKEREEFGFDSRETWCLDRTLAEWMYSRFMMYKEITVVNLDYHRYNIDGREWTQRECIDKIIENSKFYLCNETYAPDNTEVYEKLSEAIKIMSEVIFDMWW